MKSVLLAAAAVCCFAWAAGIKCLTCDNARSNKECEKKGKVIECQPNEDACHNEIRTDDRGVIIKKRCKESTACADNFAQNEAAAWTLFQCNLERWNAVCRCCCYHDACNADFHFCRGEKADCSAIGTPAFGTRDCEYANRWTQVGSKCHFSCNEGYALVGSNLSECTRYRSVSKWSNPVPACVRQVCEVLRTPLNGRMNCTDENKRSSVCRFHCKSGFTLKGQTTTECTESNKWTNPPPICISLRCFPPQSDPRNGRAFCSNYNVVGSICTFTCNEGFRRLGALHRNCDDDGDGDFEGRWSKPSPVCKVISCDPLPTSPVHGSMSCTAGNEYGSECTFTCNEGYVLSDEQPVKCAVQCEVCSGKWDRPTPTCTVKKCDPRHEGLKHGTVACTDGNRFGSVCQFRCDANYFLHGSSATTCDDAEDDDVITPAWSHPAPVCRGVVCNRGFSSLKNGAISCSDGTAAQSACTFTCKAGYQLIGAEQSICQDDGDGDELGVWTNKVPVCKAVTCKPIYDNLASGSVSCTKANRQDSTCTFSCNDGYILIGDSNQSTCLNDDDGDALGAWTNPPPVCTEIKCPPYFKSLENGKVKCTRSNAYGSVCSFFCNQGYVIVEESDKSECQDDGDGDDIGEWTHEEPLCTQVRCPPPHRDPDNGAVSCTDGQVGGSVCSFTCDEGFVVVGSLVSTCQDDINGDAYGQWSQPAPTCKMDVCNPVQTAPEFGSVLCSDDNRVGSVCDFQCGPGYFLDGSTATTCGDARWSHPAPVCTPVVCSPAFSDLKDGTISCTDGNFAQSSCTFTCKAGYELIGADQSTCQDDDDGNEFGAWSSKAPVCKAILCPSGVNKKPEKGRVKCSKGNRVGSTCEYKCNNRYAVIGSPTSVCEIVEEAGEIVGAWSHDPPACEKIVCEPRFTSIVNGRVSCSKSVPNSLGSVCTFACTSGFAIFDQSDTSVCRDDDDGDALGEWSHPAPTCQPIQCRPPHSNPANGEVSCSNSNFVNSVCTFSCSKPNYELVGIQRSRCTDDGAAGGVWNQQAPTCQKRSCGEAPAAPENGFRVCTDGNFIGSQCEYGCDAYHRREGPLYSTCRQAPSGLLAFDNPAPVCVPIKCAEVTEIANGEISCSNNNFATSVCSYQCNSQQGYTLYPLDANLRECRNDSEWDKPAPCCTLMCPPNAKMDLVVIMDSSSSVGPYYWNLQTEFVLNLLKSFTLGDHATRMSVFRYNTDVDSKTEIKLNDVLDDMDELARRFNAIPFTGGGTNTGRALKYARDVHFTVENGNRPDVKDVAFIITDGRSKDDVAAVSLQLREDDVTIIAIAIGMDDPKDYEQMMQITGDAENTFIVQGGFEGLGTELIEKIAEKVCGKPCQ